MPVPIAAPQTNANSADVCAAPLLLSCGREWQSPGDLAPGQAPTRLLLMYRAATEITILLHLGFVAFVVAGGILARRRRWLMGVHLAALTWAVYAELSPGIVCPLTALENFFAMRAGIRDYRGDFVAHYLAPVIYQEGLSQKGQDLLVVIVLALNAAIYASLLLRTARALRRGPC